MIHKLYPRKELTVSTIGYPHFWFGLALGLGYAVTLYLSMNGIRDGLPWILANFEVGRIWVDLIIHPGQRYIHNLLVASLASVLGEHICLSIWITGSCRHIKLQPLHRAHQRAITNLFFGIGGVLLILIINFPPFLAYHTSLRPRYRGLPLELEAVQPPYNVLLHSDHLLYWFLLVIFLFFFQFMIVRNLYRCSRWMILFASFAIVFAVIFAHINIVRF